MESASASAIKPATVPATETTAAPLVAAASPAEEAVVAAVVVPTCWISAGFVSNENNESNAASGCGFGGIFDGDADNADCGGREGDDCRED